MHLMPSTDRFWFACPAGPMPTIVLHLQHFSSYTHEGIDVSESTESSSLDVLSDRPQTNAGQVEGATPAKWYRPAVAVIVARYPNLLAEIYVTGCIIIIDLEI